MVAMQPDNAGRIWLEVTNKVIENGTIRKLGYGFLFEFYSTCGRIFSRFDTIHERDNQPATQPAIARQQRLRLCIASRGKRQKYSLCLVTIIGFGDDTSL